ncbi:MAG: hypothetical protein FJ276_19520, partial [Planctomycetes bacterium]|nr:hypothetical protein [Planctomycetota bacterium]
MVCSRNDVVVPRRSARPHCSPVLWVQTREVMCRNQTWQDSPMIVVTCSCGKTYSLKPELAGRMVKCRRCGARLQIPRGAKRDVRGSAGETASIPEPPDEMQVTTERNTSGHTPGPSVAGPRASSGEYGSYTIVRPIGRGGMGQVSVARDEPLEREVALKQLLEEAAENPKRCRRFVEEAEITGQLEHPGVVPVYALGIDRHNRPYYAMRYVQGKTLHQAIHEHHAAPSTATLRGLLRHVTMVCHTMAYAHARGIIHRDLKPSNIIVGEFGETLILDWGLARPVEDRGAPSSTMGDLADRRLAGRGEVTTPGGPAGTPQYMSPEQAMGKSDELGPATDIYSLGAILYQILTGRPAYQGTSSSAVLQQVKAGPPQTPSMVRAGVPRPLEAICLKAMARQPNDRYPSSATLGKDLDRWLDDEPVTAYREPVREWAVRWARRHKAAAGTLFLAFVSIVIGSATMAVMVTRERARTTAATFLAEQYDRQAADAIELAQEKDEQADRLTREAAEARSQAEAAARQATESSAAAEQAKSRIAQLESDLKTQTQDTEALTRQLEQIRAELAALEARAAAETERALAAEKKAIALEREASDLRAAARDLRRLAADLTELALRASGQGTSTPPATTSIPELTEDDAATFDVTGVDGSGCQLVSDSSRVVFGRQSLLVRSGSAKQVRVAYPHRRNARWDLSTRDHLWLAVSVVDEDVVFQQGSPRIRLGRGSRYVEYQAPAGCLAENRATWTLFKIPLAGDANWQRTDVNGLDFSRVDWLEIHMASDKAGLLLWLDDIQFGPAQDQPPKAVAPFDAAQARKHQEAWAKYLNVPVEMINSLGMKFVLIPPGEFDMGFPQPEVDELLGEMRQSGNRSFVD